MLFTEDFQKVLEDTQFGEPVTLRFLHVSYSKIITIDAVSLFESTISTPKRVLYLIKVVLFVFCGMHVKRLSESLNIIELKCCIVCVLRVCAIVDHQGHAIRSGPRCYVT